MGDEAAASSEARAGLQRALAAALDCVAGAGDVLSLECLHAAAPGVALQHTVFYVTGFLTEDEAESAQSAARVAALHEALPLPPAALNLVRVTWASGSAGAALRSAHATAAEGALGIAKVMVSLSPVYMLGRAVYSLVGGEGGGGGSGSSGGGGAAANAQAPLWSELDFRGKHRHAKYVGKVLGEVLQALAAGGGGGGGAQRRVLLGHSLGGRIVLHALARLAPQAPAPGAGAAAEPAAAEPAAPPPQQQQPVVAAAAIFGAAQAGPEDKGEVWADALRALPAAGALFNVYNPHDPALSAMGTVGKLLQVDGRARFQPAGLRPVAAPAPAPAAAQLLNVDASPFFPGPGLAHSYRAAYMQLLRCERLAPLFAAAEGAGLGQA